MLRLKWYGKNRPELVPGQRWNWDGVEFAVLHPVSNSTLETKTNNRSCVLRISNGQHSSVLTGDIESKIERQMVARYGESLAADILLAPHHGSRTSSSAPFIRNVDATYVIFSAGYRNRYRFPTKKVVDRYTLEGSKQFTTYKTGTLTLTVPASGPIGIRSWRQQQRRYWHSE